jgi:hypothetical protein
MTWRRLGTLTAVAVVAAALGWGMFAFLERQLAQPTPDAEPPPRPTPPPPAVGPHISATIYFVTEDGTALAGVPVNVPLADSPAAQARTLVEAQLNTEPPEPLSRAVPPGVTVRGVFLTGRDDAYVDLDSNFVTGLPGGSHNELLAAYAIVSTLTTNLSEISRVQILIDGREVETLTGHVDLHEPLRKNEALIRTPTP